MITWDRIALIDNELNKIKVDLDDNMYAVDEMQEQIDMLVVELHALFTDWMEERDEHL